MARISNSQSGVLQQRWKVLGRCDPTSGSAGIWKIPGILWRVWMVLSVPTSPKSSEGFRKNCRYLEGLGGAMPTSWIKSSPPRVSKSAWARTRAVICGTVNDCLQEMDATNYSSFYITANDPGPMIWARFLSTFYWENHLWDDLKMVYWMRKVGNTATTHFLIVCSWSLAGTGAKCGRGSLIATSYQSVSFVPIWSMELHITFSSIPDFKGLRNTTWSDCNALSLKKTWFCFGISPWNLCFAPSSMIATMVTRPLRWSPNSTYTLHYTTIQGSHFFFQTG